MPSELPVLLHHAAPKPSRDLDPDELWAVGRRRRRRHQVATGVVAMAIAGVVTVAAVALERQEPGQTVAAGADLVTYHDPVRGFTVRYPRTWERASTTLTPSLSDPAEILSLGTADLPAGGGRCAQVPVAALEAMSPTDAFLTVQERRSGGRDFPSRPQRFPPKGSKNNSEAVDCLAEAPVFDHWWFNFRDGGRYFHVLVAIGTQASQQTEGEAWRTLQSLEFTSPR